MIAAVQKPNSRKDLARSRRKYKRLPADMFDGLIWDYFAGGGGASEGIEEGFEDLGIKHCVDLAVNHDAGAIEMHKINHPHTRHIQDSVFHVDIRRELAGRKLSLFWASPDCTHHSKARGGAPIREKGKESRGLAWVVVDVAREALPDVIMLENVEEFAKWCPVIPLLNAKGQPVYDKQGRPVYVPDNSKSGETFREWVAALRDLGYVVEWRFLRASDYGVSTIRNRLYLIARRDGMPIVWPTFSHGNPDKKGFEQSGLYEWSPVWREIDFTQPIHSIFLTKAQVKKQKLDIKRPLVKNTMGRIAAGITQHVIEKEHPFLIEIGPDGIRVGSNIFNFTHGGRNEPGDEPLRTTTCAKRGEKSVVEATLYAPHMDNAYGQSTGADIQEPGRTASACNHQSVVSATLVGAGGSEYAGKPTPVTKPLGTVKTDSRTAMASAALVQTGYGEREGQKPRVPGLHKPVGTIVGTQKHALISAWLAKHYGGMVGVPITAPAPTCTTRGTQNHVCAAALQSYHHVKEDGQTRGQTLDQPIRTVDTQNRHAIIAAHLTHFYGTDQGGAGGMTDPAKSVSASGQHHALISALLAPYYGSGSGKTCTPADQPSATIPTKDRLSLITAIIQRGGDGLPEGFWRVWRFLIKHLKDDAPVPILVINGEIWLIVDICMRMLTPRELARCQGFPDSYELSGNKTEDVKRIGNSVCPRMARLLVWHNFQHMAIKGKARFPELRRAA